MSRRPLASDAAPVPKILGADVELGNFIEGVQSPSGTGREASRLLLAQVSGVAAGRRVAAAPVTGPTGWPVRRATRSHEVAADEDDTGSARYGAGATTLYGHALDSGRKFLPGNGGSVYIDLDHLELALPETWSAFDHVAQWRAMLRIARTAVARANRHLPAGCRVRALVNCSDGHGQAYGAHTNVLVSRSAWDAIMCRKPHYLACLAAFQVSSIVYTGAGKVGSENGRTWSDYQLTQRGDFFETLLAEQTTYHRPIVNTRSEPLCGRARSVTEPDLARLHVIFYDATLCQVATLLRVGTLQIVTAMIEAGWVSPRLALDDPLDALQRWGHDPWLTARAPLVSGPAVTAVGLQRRFLEEARRFADAHGFEGIVPRAAEILDLWEDTLLRLRDRDFDALSRRLDWVLKRQMLERAMTLGRALTRRSAEMRHLDQLYASLDEQDGLFWAYEDAGLVDVVVSEQDVQRAMQSPPEDTRAWTRAHLLRRAGAARIDEVDWDLVALRVRGKVPGWGDERRAVDLPCPFGATKRNNEGLFTRGRSLEEIVDALALEPAPLVAVPSSS